MKQPVTIEYVHAGLQPPVYVFTSLSDPQWDAVEMNREQTGDDEYRFYKTFSAEEGEYQYKFRLGPGDWWALDEGKPVVDDGAGNKNNLLSVKPAAPPQPSAPIAPTPSDQSKVVPTPASAPLMPHEIHTQVPEPPKQPSAVKPLQPTEAYPATTLNAPLAPTGTVAPAPTPLLKHETLSMDEEPRDDYFDADNQDAEDDESPPLLRHESVTLSSNEQTQAPLIRHESMGFGEHLDDDEPEYSLSQSITSTSSHHSSGEDSVAPEADPNDPSLEKFPTDQKAIFEHIHRRSSQLAENEAREDADIQSVKPMGSNGHPTSPTVASLPSVQEEDNDDDDDLQQLREEERKEAKKEMETGEVDPLGPTVIVMELEDRPAAPLTPPMTPLESEKIAERVLEAAVEAEIQETGPAADARVQEIVQKVMEAETAAGAENQVGDETHILLGGNDEQKRGFFAYSMPLLAFVGIALAVAAGVWKAGYV